NIMIDTQSRSQNTTVKSITENRTIKQKLSYISDDDLPYWVIYRDKFFDEVFVKMEFDIFDVFRDRQITTKNSTLESKY
ncbi:hypothetical protein QP445_16705, partial [Micrococcus luteus]|nr:hypothetical protein [Micrococcus luteus]